MGRISKCAMAMLVAVALMPAPARAAASFDENRVKSDVSRANDKMTTMQFEDYLGRVNRQYIGRSVVRVAYAGNVVPDGQDCLIYLSQPADQGATFHWLPVRVPRAIGLKVSRGDLAEVAATIEAVNFNGVTRLKPVSIRRWLRPTEYRPKAHGMRSPTQSELAQLAAARRKRAEDEAALKRATAGTPTAVERPTEPDRAKQSVADDPQDVIPNRGLEHAPLPEYPAVAQMRGWTGSVLVRVTVSPSGEVTGAQMLRSSGYPELDRAAIRAASGYRFAPLGEGITRQDTGVIPFDFRLQ